MRDLLLEFAITLPVLLLSMVFHEVSHGYVALRLGDRTAQDRGRLSLNPLRHLDRFGTLVLFLTYFGSGGQMLFGWAKPVPINPRSFKSPQKGMAWVGVAGPTANFMLAATTALILERWIRSDTLVTVALFRIFQLNIILMLFNLLPVPPLDGSRIIGGFMPVSLYMRWISLDRFGQLFVMIVLFFLISIPGMFSDVLRSIYSLFLPSFGF